MTPSQYIDRQIANLTDWRGPALAKLRTIINRADTSLAEDWKWNTGVWVSNGLVCAASAFKDHIKLNIFNGASIEDPNHLFNAGLEGKKGRAIDFAETDVINEVVITDLIKRAVAYNAAA